SIGVALRPAPLPVEVGRVIRGPLEVTVDAEGRTRVRDRYRIAAPTSGRLERIAVREGEVVELGAVIARLAPVPLDPQTATQARARLAGAQALEQEASTRVAQFREALDQARRSRVRARELTATGALSAEERERAEHQLASAEREYEAALSRARAAATEVDAARSALLALEPSGAVLTVRSPTAGRVLQVYEENERVVLAGTPLLEVGDPATLELVVDVLSRDAVKIRPGARLRVEGWGEEEVLQGWVRSVEPSAFTRVSVLGVEEQRVHVIADLAGAPATLGDGFQAEVRIVVWEDASVLSAPVSALFRSGEDWAVYVVEGERARLRPVRIGRRGAAHVEVLEGLQEGDPIILFPSDRIHDGVRVR
ncbi:MAG TPA: efflux RND transporter periplasmic adaptor subunit, partial [Longimicrobiaceae bacterium]|nr:efflux RND transporter periplasmic adaptor subunit [Longimicrobiaceae bacterium]